MPSDRMLEYYYAMGQDCVRAGDYDEAVTYFRKAANMGAAEGAAEICLIARRFETGDGVPKDEEKARLFYEAAADYGDIEASLLLGELYLRGVNGGRPNARKARRHLERACEAGSGEAAASLGRMYDEGSLGRVNEKKAFQYHLLAAERGVPDAMLMAGLCYAQGTAVKKDLARAEEWIRKGAAKSEDGAATLRTFLSIAATEYAAGEAGVIDDEKAFAMAEEAEALGNREAFLLLGEAYRGKVRREGHGEKAFRCFLRADAEGIPRARASLGLCWEAGIGTQADIGKAVACYRDAAEKGEPFAMARLGYAYEKGEGIEKNDRLAMQWLIKAAMRGDKGAVHTLREDFDYHI